MRFCAQCGQQVETELHPEWFVMCIEELGEDHPLIAELLDSPSTITSDPTDLPQTLLTQHQDTIEGVLGQSITFGTNLSERIDSNVDLEDEDGSIMVGVPYKVAQQVDYSELTARRTSDGLVSLLDGNNDVVATVDPLAIE